MADETPARIKRPDPLARAAQTARAARLADVAALPVRRPRGEPVPVVAEPVVEAPPEVVPAPVAVFEEDDVPAMAPTPKPKRSRK